MNYSNIYKSIIKYRQKNTIDKNDGYSELHHILPRSLGGKDIASNLVRLRAKEHYTCHLLLTKMYKEGTPAYYKMVTAWNNMSVESGNQCRNISKGAMYERLRLAFSKSMSYHQSGNKNSQYGLVWIHNPATLESLRICKDNDVPEGFKKGRKPKVINKKRNKIFERYNLYLTIYEKNGFSYFCNHFKYKKSELYLLIMFKKYIVNLDEKHINRIKLIENNKKNIISYEDNVKIYTKYYEIYNSYGKDEFIKITGYDKTIQNLIANFKKYVKEYKPQNGKIRGNVKKKNYIVKSSKAFKKCIVDGTTYKTIAQASKETGIQRNTISKNLKNGVFDREQYDKNCIKGRRIPIPIKSC